jgi:hypothetical protein
MLSESITTKGIIDAINQARSRKNLIPLRYNNIIDIATDIQAKQMANTGQFGHVLKNVKYPTLADRMKASGHSFSNAGEVLYAGNGYDPDMVVSLWVASKPHREAILHPDVEEIGASIQRSTDGRTYVCAVVCIPRDGDKGTEAGNKIIDTIKRHGKAAGKKMLANIVQSDQMREIKSPIIQKIIAALKNMTID